MDLDFSTSTPIYLQIIEEFKRQIATGLLKPGDKLPSQRDLAADLKVNANTVQRAYREMEILGLVETQRGQGTFVRQTEQIVEGTRTEMLSKIVEDFVAAMLSLGLTKGEALQLVQARFEEMEEEKGVDAE